MRLALIGSGSFIARHVMHSAAQQGLDTVVVERGADLDEALHGADAAIGFSLDPRFRTQPYLETADYELAAAQAATRQGARFVMLSSRRVYPPDHRWNASETGPATGDETVYGRNKARTEDAVRAATGGQALILRLSNIVGFEYDPADQRRTFMALVMRSLKNTGEIYYDMHPDTQRDFLTVTLCARSVVDAVRLGAAGTFNLGCGFPISCGAIASWVMEGYGGGSLTSKSNDVRDSFFLDMAKWRGSLPFSVTPEGIRNEVIDMGRRLRDA